MLLQRRPDGNSFRQLETATDQRFTNRVVERASDMG